jgi:cytochrome c6
MIIPRFILTATLLISVSFIAFANILQKSNIPVNGRGLFESKCARCHGKDGTRGLFGAKNLQTSKLTEDERIHIITHGKRIMPSWKNKLSETQIKLVAQYIQTLRR